jgi:hypothetical protein
MLRTSPETIQRAIQPVLRSMWLAAFGRMAVAAPFLFNGPAKLICLPMDNRQSVSFTTGSRDAEAMLSAGYELPLNSGNHMWT